MADFALRRPNDLAEQLAAWRREHDRGQLTVRDLTASDAAPQGTVRVNRPRGFWAQFTRDAGMHRSGALLSAAHDRCLSLVLCFFDPIRPGAQGVRPQDHALAADACRGAFGRDLDRVWVEPPDGLNPTAQRFQMYAYRLFVGDDWQTPVPLPPPLASLVAWPDWRGRLAEHGARVAVAAGAGAP